jgi:hypothetical protein
MIHTINAWICIYRGRRFVGIDQASGGYPYAVNILY